MDPIGRWDDFKRQLTNYFCPAKSGLEGKIALFTICQKGTLKEYVKEFTELHLQNSQVDEDTLLAVFVKGFEAMG